MKYRVFKLLITLALLSISIAQVHADRSCRIEGYPYAITCGKFSSNSQWQTKAEPIELAWYKVPSRAKYPQQTPIIWIPEIGVSASTRAPSFISALSRLRSHYDIVWLEPRGTNLAQIQACQDKILPSLEGKIYRFSDVKFLNDCQQQLQSLGGIEQFSSEQQVEDYEKFRKTLNVSQMIVIAEGKSASIALAWQQKYPNAIKAMVFDSQLINNHQSDTQIEAKAERVYQAIAASVNACKTAKRCRQQYPNTNAQLQQVIHQLPQTIQIEDPQTGVMQSLTIDHVMFSSMLNNIIRNPNKTVLLPTLLSSAVKGDWKPLLGAQSLSWSKRPSTFNYGVYLANQCLGYETKVTPQPHNNMTFKAWYAAVELQKLDAQCKGLANQQKQKATLKLALLPATLILTGGLDPLIEESPILSLTNVAHIQVKNAGAGIFNFPCAKDVVYYHIKQTIQANAKNNKSIQEVASCLANIPYPSSDMPLTTQLANGVSLQ